MGSFSAMIYEEGVEEREERYLRGVRWRVG
jgi:hypothetical protein